MSWILWTVECLKNSHLCDNFFLGLEATLRGWCSTPWGCEIRTLFAINLAPQNPGKKTLKNYIRHQSKSLNSLNQKPPFCLGGGFIWIFCGKYPIVQPSFTLPKKSNGWADARCKRRCVGKRNCLRRPRRFWRKWCLELEVFGPCWVREKKRKGSKGGFLVKFMKEWFWYILIYLNTVYKCIYNIYVVESIVCISFLQSHQLDILCGLQIPFGYYLPRMLWEDMWRKSQRCQSHNYDAKQNETQKQLSPMIVMLVLVSY